MYRGVFPEWSPRTLARYVAALRRMYDTGKREETLAVLKRATRKNGTINVSRFAEMTEAIAAMWVVEHCQGAVR
jgi:hypothetical protein